MGSEDPTTTGCATDTTDLPHFMNDNGLALSFVSAAGGDRIMTEPEQKLLKNLRQERGDALYSDFLFTLTHKYYEPAQAEPLWREILEHKYTASTMLRRNIRIVVAALDYLSNVSGNLESVTAIPEQSIAHITEIAFKDGLTTLFDLTTFRMHLDVEIDRYQRYNQPVALILLDVDDFKLVNDRQGHRKGDDVLIRLASIIKENLRKLDIGARCGGDEFGVLLPGTRHDGALMIAERIRTLVSHGFSRNPLVTISAGVASCPRNARSANGLRRKADEALYYSKWHGKNRVTASGPEVHKEFCSQRITTARDLPLPLEWLA